MLGKIVITFVAAACLSGSLALPARAQLTVEDLWREAFSGWGGIVFMCETAGTNFAILPPLSSFESEVCSAAIEDARFLANALGVPFVGCTNCRGLRYARFIEQYGENLSPLELTLHLDVVESATLIGGAAHVEAGAVYARAVDQGLVNSPGSPRTQPRGGLLSLWSSTRAFYGSPSVLAPSAISAIRTMLTSFFADFALSR